MALKVLKDYYAAGDEAMLQTSMNQPAKPEFHEKSSGAGGGIIGMLEVIESDFAKNLAQETTQEDSAELEYTKTTQENKISKTMKESDVKYKGKEAASLDKSISELSSDLDATKTESGSLWVPSRSEESS